MNKSIIFLLSIVCLQNMLHAQSEFESSITALIEKMELLQHKYHQTFSQAMQSEQNSVNLKRLEINLARLDNQIPEIINESKRLTDHMTQQQRDKLEHQSSQLLQIMHLTRWTKISRTSVQPLQNLIENLKHYHR